MYRYISYFTIVSFLIFFTSCSWIDDWYLSGDNYLDDEKDQNCGYSLETIENCGTTSEPYKAGCTISPEHQEMEFSFCYPRCSSSEPEDCLNGDVIDFVAIDSTFSFSNYADKILMIEMSASW